MTGFDYAVLAVLGLSAVIGIWRGLLREVFALAAWIAATLVAMLFAGEAAAMLPANLRRRSCARSSPSSCCSSRCW